MKLNDIMLLKAHQNQLVSFGFSETGGKYTISP